MHAELTWQATFRRDSIAYIPLMDANSLWLGARMHSARADHNTRVSCTVPAKGAAAAWSNCHRRATNKDLHHEETHMDERTRVSTSFSTTGVGGAMRWSRVGPSFVASELIGLVLGHLCSFWPGNV